jgi:hypothetical protein
MRTLLLGVLLASVLGCGASVTELQAQRDELLVTKKRLEMDVQVLDIPASWGDKEAKKLLVKAEDELGQVSKSLSRVEKRLSAKIKN